MIIRDILFYMTGFVYGVAKLSCSDCVRLYNSMQIQNDCMIKWVLKQRDISKTDQN
jgi:hypothetical protein